MTYPKSYHTACAHLVAFGGWNYAEVGRALCARALRDMRRTRPHAEVREIARGMQFIAGHFPIKGQS